MNRRQTAVTLALILAAGAVLRAAYLAELRSAPDFQHPTLDAGFHDYWAHGLVTGDWKPPPGEGDPMIRDNPYLRPPAYPYFLAAIYKAAGVNYLAVRAVQMTLGLVSVLLVFLIARRAFDARTGLMASALTASYWILIYFEGELEEPVLAVLAALVVLWLLLCWDEHPTPLRALLSGLALGLLALVRPNALLFAPVAAAWMISPSSAKTWTRRWTAAALLAVGLVLALAPCAVRNRRVSGEWVLVSCNGPLNLYIGNHPESDGIVSRIPDLQKLTGLDGWDWFEYPELVRRLARAEGFEPSFRGASAYFTRRAVDFVREHPALSFRRMLLKAGRFWGVWEVPNTKILYYDRAESRVLRILPGYPMALALFLVGLVTWNAEPRQRPEGGRARRGGALLLLFMAVYFLSFVPFLVAARFRAPLIPFMLMFGAQACVSVLDWLKKRERAKAALASALAVCLWLIFAVRTTADPNRSQWHFDRGQAFARAGAIEEAVAEYREALRLMPSYLEARLRLVALLRRKGDLARAVEECKLHLEECPEAAPVRTLLRRIEAESHPAGIGDAR